MSVRVTEPGFYELPMPDYIADPAPQPSLSASIAHQLVSRSALHAWTVHPRLNPQWTPDGSDATDYGTIAHALLIGVDNDRVVVVDAPDWRTNAAKAVRAAARQAGKPVILRHQLDHVVEMVTIAREAISNSEFAGVTFDAERTGIWREDETWFRIRPDWVTPDRTIVLDYKTTAGSAQPDAWARGPLIQLGLDLQAALVIRGLTALAAPRTCHFVYVVQEAREPYGVSLIELSAAYLEFAHRRLASAIQQWTYCMTERRWPSYPSRVVAVEPPGWATFQWEMTEALRDEGRPLSEEL